MDNPLIEFILPAFGLLYKLPKVEKCCFCVDLKHGCFIIGYTEMIKRCLLLVPLLSIIGFQSTNLFDKLISVTAVLGAMSSIWLVISLHKGSGEGLFIWCFSMMIYVLVEAIFALAFFLLVSVYGNWGVASLFLFVGLFSDVVLTVYFISAVQTYWEQMKAARRPPEEPDEHNPLNSGPDNQPRDRLYTNGADTPDNIDQEPSQENDVDSPQPDKDEGDRTEL